MSRIFTITKGLENMGALKTGGQGSVYKARRTGEIITAIKILPTPLHSQSESDKNFISFQNEVNKLKKVNEHPNPNVVTILGSGMTDSGNFPFIEMEYIDGPDLAELLKPPHPPVFTIEETVKVASHISNALAHCHKAGVMHGDIKSNNIKFNIHTGNYMLLDFGLSLLTDEERRTSLRNAGAIEFMAPEQNEGSLFFESDIYSFGIILFELLAGSVPFHLSDGGESSRHKVLTSHLEEPAPDLLELRKKLMPDTWHDAKRKDEINVPEWLVHLVYKCLEKNPADRYKDGMTLYNSFTQSRYILSTSQQSVDLLLKEENERLKRDKILLQKIIQKQPDANSLGYTLSDRVSGSLFSFKRVILLILVLLAGGTFAYLYYTTKNKSEEPATVETNPNSPQLASARQLVNSGKFGEAISIYKGLASSEDPEALYELGNLGLRDEYDIDCATSLHYLNMAAGKNYPPAKRTLGLIYTSDPSALARNNYIRCKVPVNYNRGSRLLMEAMIAGDAIAGRLLDELNTRIQRARPI